MRQHQLAHDSSLERSYSGLHYDLSHWRLSTGVEVDFIAGEMQVAIEAKSARRIDDDDLKGLR